MNKLLLILITFASFTLQGQWARSVIELTDDLHHITHIGQPRQCYTADFGNGVVKDTYVRHYWLSLGDDVLTITDADDPLFPRESFTWVGEQPTDILNVGFYYHRVRRDELNWDCD